MSSGRANGSIRYEFAWPSNGGLQRFAWPLLYVSSLRRTFASCIRALKRQHACDGSDAPGCMT